MKIRAATAEVIAATWQQGWSGAPILSVCGRRYEVEDVAGLELVEGSERRGLVTWAIEGTAAEVVSLDALPPGAGHGARLLAAAEAALGDRGVARVRLVTSDDNSGALRFYQRQGYRLVRIHLDALTLARRQKPAIPERGAGGAPLRDLWELEKTLGPAPAAVSHPLTILAVDDLARAVSFYRGAFGWRARVEVPVYVELELPDGRGLGLYVRDGFARNAGVTPTLPPPGAISGAEIYLHCADLEATMAQVKRAGGRLLSPLAPRDWGDEAAYFADPDGNVVVVARPLAAQG